MDDVPPLSDWEDIRSERKKKSYSSKEDVPYLKQSQVDDLVDHVPSPTVRNELLIRLATQTGLRRGELVRLKLEDGTWTEAGNEEIFAPGRPRTITIRPEVAKNGEKRIVGWNSTLDFTLKRWIEDYRPNVAMASESEYLFPSNRSEHITGQTFNDIVTEAADNAEIQSVHLVNKNGAERRAVTAHVLRHTFAMSCLAEGWDIYALSEALGHS